MDAFLHVRPSAESFDFVNWFWQLGAVEILWLKHGAVVFIDKYQGELRWGNCIYICFKDGGAAETSWIYFGLPFEFVSSLSELVNIFRSFSGPFKTHLMYNGFASNLKVKQLHDCSVCRNLLKLLQVPQELLLFVLTCLGCCELDFF